MIPVPDSELELYDMNSEEDEEYKEYKSLVMNEMIFIRKNKEKIIKNAQLIYKQKQENDGTAGYVKSALDYTFMESLCDKFKRI